ncbi:MAG: hypothetical protein R3F03_03960 [Opitutaceae bacterium]
MMNGWRTLLIHGLAGWRSVRCGWASPAANPLHSAQCRGDQRRRAGLGRIAPKRLTGTKKLLWLDAPTNYFAGSFTYKNHAGAFFVLILAVCLGLAWWHMVRARARTRKSNPGMLYVFLGLIAFTALAFTYARAATALGAALLLLAGLAYTVRLFFRAGGPPPLVSALTSVARASGFSCSASFPSTPDLSGANLND